MNKIIHNFSFIALLFCSSLLHAEIDTSEVCIISAGMTVVNGALLRSEPNSDSKIIEELDFGVPFIILRKKSFIKGRGYTWYKVKLVDNEIKGWISGDDGREGNYDIIDFEKHDYTGLYYSVAIKSLWGYNDYDAAEELLLYILKKYSNRNIPIKDAIFDETTYVNGKLAACKALAEVYKRKKDYQSAIKYYKKVMQLREAKRQDVAEAIRNIMLVYKNDLKDDVKTVEICHKIIKEFPDEEISKFEWNLWIDIEAADTIIKTYSVERKNAKKLERESNRIITETSNPPVVLIAMRGRIISQIYMGKFDVALALLLDVTRKYPKD